MKRLTEIIESLRVHHVAAPKHAKALRHVHHGFHAAYLGCYVAEWHMPLSLMALALLVLALASWVAPWLQLESE